MNDESEEQYFFHGCLHFVGGKIGRVGRNEWEISGSMQIQTERENPHLLKTIPAKVRYPAGIVVVRNHASLSASIIALSFCFYIFGGRFRNGLQRFDALHIIVE